MGNQPSNIKDIMYDFLKEPTKENFSKFIKYNTGEYDIVDFKAQWIESQKLAQIILGIANSGGGAIIFGIQETSDGTNDAVGLDKIKDKADVFKETYSYLPKQLKFDVIDLDFSDAVYSTLLNRKYQLLLIDSDNKDLPYLRTKSGDVLKDGVIYIRRGTNTLPANTNELQTLISKRIDSMYSNTSEIELQEHLTQLKVLYDNIEEEYTTREFSVFSNTMQNLVEGMFGKSVIHKNEKYPNESFDDFIAKMIERKKMKIEKVLDLK